MFTSTRLMSICCSQVLTGPSPPAHSSLTRHSALPPPSAAPAAAASTAPPGASASTVLVQPASAQLHILVQAERGPPLAVPPPAPPVPVLASALLLRSRSNRLLAPAPHSASSAPLQPLKPPRLHSPRPPPLSQHSTSAEPDASHPYPYVNTTSPLPFSSAQTGSSFAADEPLYANTQVAREHLSSARPERLSSLRRPPPNSHALSALGGQEELEVPVSAAGVRRVQQPASQAAGQPMRAALVRSASVRSSLSLSQTSPELSLSHLRSAQQRFPDVMANLSLVATATSDESSTVPDRASLFTDQQVAKEQSSSRAALVRPLTRFTTFDEQLVEAGPNMSQSLGSTLEPASLSLALAPDADADGEADATSAADSVSLNSLLAPNLEVLSSFHVPEQISDLFPARSTNSPAATPQSTRLRPSASKRSPLVPPKTHQSQPPPRPLRSHSVHESSPRSPFASQELLLQVASPTLVSVELMPFSLPPASFTFEDLPERRYLQELQERFSRVAPARDSSATGAGSEFGGEASRPTEAERGPSALRPLADEYNVQQLCAEHRHAFEMMCVGGERLASSETQLVHHSADLNASAAGGPGEAARRHGPCPLCVARPSLPLDGGVYNPRSQNVRGVKRYYGAHAAHFRQFLNYFEHFYSHPYTQLLGTRTTGFKQLIAQRNSAT